MQYRTTSYAAYTFDTFYFEKNLQGDIIAVYNASGEKIGTYTYDAWGNMTVATTSGNTTLENGIVRTLNPFRYRGYYYDTETQLYYLQSRYYNPAWGRFLNADGLISTGQGLLGYNIYAYCNNNPVMHIDPSGMQPGCGACPSCLSGLPDECTLALNKSVPTPDHSRAIRRRKADYAQYRWNASEEAVLQADGLAWYRGALVVKMSFGRLKKEAFSFGILFIGTEIDDVNTVKHEYGHYVHLQQIGWEAYVTMVAVPSLYGYWSGVDYNHYYKQPCEYVADKLGKVSRGANYLSAEDIEKGEEYHRKTIRYGRRRHGYYNHPFY